MPSPRSLLAISALVVLAAFDATTAAAARLDVSRRVDPSLDASLFTPLAQTPLAALTADQRWISSHASPLVVHDSDPRVSQFLTGWATKPKLAAYLNGTGVHPSHTVEMEQAKEWFVSANGVPVFVDGWRTLDLRIPAARKWWLYGTDGKASCNPDIDQRAALDLYACGYKSLWIDNALTTPKQGLTPTPDIPEKAWASGVLTMLSQLRSLKPKGTTFTINMHWTDTDFGYAAKPKVKASAPSIRAGRYADQVIIEGGAIDRGLHYSLPAKQPWSYRRLLNFADQMHKAKTKLQWEKTGSPDLVSSKSPLTGAIQLPGIASCNDRDLAAPWVLGDASWKAHVQTAAFNYATALLTFKKGDSVGDMCEYPQRGWRGYEANLGNARGKRYEKSGFVVRKFSAGIVAVNSTDATKVFRIPSGKKGVDLGSQAYPQPTAKVKAVRVPPRSAAVVKY